MIDPGEFIRVVGSSNIEAIAYNEEDLSLYVIFANKSGGMSSTYKYSNVGQDVFDELLDADSKGRFIHARIKNRYEYQKVELED